MHASSRSRAFMPSFSCCLILVSLFAASMTLPAFSKTSRTPEPRVAQQIDEGSLITLAGNTRPEAKNAAYDRGPVADTFELDHMLLVLQRSPALERRMDRLIDSLNDRNSPNFHRWLTAQQFGERYGVAPEDIETLTNWLESHGFRVNQVYPSRMLIDFSGPAYAIRETFHTSIHQLDVNGEAHVANVSDPQIPAALAPVVKGIASLNDFKPHPMNKPATDYSFAGCTPSASVPTEPGTCYAMTPVDNQTIYNLNPLYNAGFSGQGQTIYLVEDTDTYGASGTNGTGDWNTYRSTFGLSTNFPLGSYTLAHPGSCTDPGTNGDDGEAAIDVEVATAIAPSAAIELISCPSTTFTFGGQIALQNLINQSSPTVGVVSVSYGECEVLNGAGNNALFNSTYQQAAAEGFSVFVSSGDEGPSSCSNEFSVGSEYDVTSLGVTGWGETPYNVTVGGTDFEDTYFSKEGGAPLSTYWSPTNGTYYGSALSYIPEIPWNDACASALISEVATGSFIPYGASPAVCNNSTFDVSTSYLSTGAASGGASNCATGAASTNQSSYLITQPDCQGYNKPSYQSGSSLAGGLAVYGQPSDGVRDIPDVSMFAANGVWGHYEVVCWSDPKYTSDGSASCSGAPSSWAGFGGTSVASPAMAAIQALVNQRTGEYWGNPNPIYYQIGQNQYGTAGGTFNGSNCNSSAGNPGGCAFNDVTQGDIDLACENNGTLEEAHCYLPAGTYGVDSTDNVTAATVIAGGTGYTSAPTCTIAGPSNNNPYLSPTGSTLWAGGSQATCSASVNSGTTTAVWTAKINAGPSASWSGLTFVVGPTTYTFVTALTAANQVLLVTSGSSSTKETDLAKNLEAAINANSAQCVSSPCFGSGTVANPAATATESTSTVTMTATTTGSAGNFSVSWGPGFQNGPEDIVITNTTPGQGPNYVSGITITAPGSGYQPETPITLTGGGGTGAIAVANTSIGTASSSYQPAYGAAPGWDMATGLGTPNASALVCNGQWGTVCSSSAVASSLNPSVYGQAVNFAATVTGNNPTGTVQFYVDGGLFDTETLVSGTATSISTSTLSVGTHTVTAMYSGDANNSGSTGILSGGQVVNTASAGISVGSSVNPSNSGQSVTFTATISGQYGLLKKRGAKPQDVTGTVQWSGNTGCGTVPVVTGNPGTATCTTTTLPVGTDVITATYSGDANHSGGTGTLSGGQVVNQVSTTVGVSSSLDPSTYGQAVNFAATVTGNNPTGTVQFYVDGGLFDTETLMSGVATSINTSTLAVGTHTVTATYSGDANNTGGTGTLSGGQVVNTASAGISVGSSLNPSNSGQSVTFTATISGQYGLLKKRGAKPQDVTGTVQWSGNTGCGTVPVVTGNPGTATCTTTTLPVGTDVITATYSGDANHSGGTGTLSGGQVVNQVSTTVGVSSSLDPSTYGQTVNFAATVTGNNPTGTVQFYVDGGLFDTETLVSGTATSINTSTLAVGTHTVTATYSGDANNGGGTGTLSGGQVVNTASAGISVGSSLNPSNSGQSVTFTATISGQYGLLKKRGAKPQDVTGTVQWSDDTGCGTVPVVTGNPGTATCTTTTLPVGTDVITATYSGDANHSGGSGTLSGGQVVNALSQTITFTTNAPSSAAYNTSFTVAATASSGLPVAFTSAGSCSNVGATYTMTSGAGTCSVIGNQAGNYEYGPAPQVTETVTATQASQTITFTVNAPSQAMYGTSFTVAASASSGLAVVYNSAGACSNMGPTYTMTSGTGTCTVTASQPGNSNYQAATPVNEFTTAQRANQTVTFTGAPALAPYNSTFVLLATSNDPSEVAYITGNNPTVCALSGNYAPVTVSVLKSTGKCTFTASWGADQNYNPASLTQNTTAEKATPVITWATPAPINYGTPLSATQLDATANVSGTFTYTPAAGKIENAGNNTLSATFKPTSANYTTATASVTLQVLPATTETTITSASQTVKLSKTGVATSTLDFDVTSYKPTGSVTLTATTGETCSGTLTSSTGKGSCKLTFTTTGARTITATYPGDSNHTGSNNSGQNPPVTVTVNPY